MHLHLLDDNCESLASKGCEAVDKINCILYSLTNLVEKKYSKFTINLLKSISHAGFLQVRGSSLEAAESELGLGSAKWPFWSVTVLCISGLML